MSKMLKYNKNQKDILIEMKNQIENIINSNDINNIIRKIKLIKILIENLISENEKNLKNIQSLSDNNNNIKIDEMKNINLLKKKKNVNNLETIVVNNFKFSEQKLTEKKLNNKNR